MDKSAVDQGYFNELQTNQHEVSRVILAMAVGLT